MRKSGIITIIVTGVALALAAASPARAEPSAEGVWEQVDEDGHVGAWFQISERGGVYEGKIVKAFFKPGEKRDPLCTRCVGAERNAPLVGLTLIKGMRRDGLRYKNGTILDPRDGTVYRALMEVHPSGQKLAVRGYVGTPHLGRTQIWKRLPESAQSQPSTAAATTR